MTDANQSDAVVEHWSWAANSCPPGEPIKGKTYRADGWGYYDFPRMGQELWAKTLEAIGADNFAPLTLANYGRSARGQLIISPTGIERLEAWVSQPTPGAGGEKG